MIRSFVRDILCLYIGYALIANGMSGQNIPSNTLIIFGALLLFFTLWFLLEKIGVLPKLTP